MPVVQVKMSDEFHKALKQYAAFLGMPMGELLYRFARFGFHEQAHSCNWMSQTLEHLRIEPDKGSDKPCFGFRCNFCNESTTCRTGVYNGLCVFDERYKHVVTEHGLRVNEENEETWLSHIERLKSSH